MTCKGHALCGALNGYDIQMHMAILHCCRAIRARGCSALTLLLAMLFRQLQSSQRALQRLWSDGCQLDRLCFESIP